jgi:PAS domain S-box-containing protein
MLRQRTRRMPPGRSARAAPPAEGALFMPLRPNGSPPRPQPGHHLQGLMRPAVFYGPWPMIAVVAGGTLTAVAGFLIVRAAVTPDAWLPWVVLGGVLLYTLLLAVYLATLREHGARVQRLAEALGKEVEERKLAEQEAKRSSDFLGAVLDTAGALVAVLDREGGIVGVNRALSRLSGYSAEEVTAMPIWDFLPPEEVDEAKQLLQVLLGGAAVSQRDNHLVGKDGRVHLVTWSATPLLDAEGHVEYVVVSGIDVTDRHRAEEAEKAAELAHVMRLSALGELATGLAHEINQPLGAIVNYAQGSLRRIQAQGPPPAGVAEALEEVVRQAMRASEIIQHLRQLVRKEPGGQGPVDLNPTVRELMRLLHGETVRVGVQVELDLADGLPPVFANQVQIEQVLINLVNNALDAMQAVERHERRLRISTRLDAPDKAVRVTVCDTGPGIPERHRDRIFEPFQSTKPGGLGMGLSISWSIIQAHRGRLWLEPQQPSGTCFHFTLPIVGLPNDDTAGHRAQPGSRSYQGPSKGTPPREGGPLHARDTEDKLP